MAAGSAGVSFVYDGRQFYFSMGQDISAEDKRSMRYSSFFTALQSQESFDTSGWLLEPAGDSWVLARIVGGGGVYIGKAVLLGGSLAQDVLAPLSLIHIYRRVFLRTVKGAFRRAESAHGKAADKFVRPLLRQREIFAQQGGQLLGHIGEVLRPAVGQVCVKAVPHLRHDHRQLMLHRPELNGRFAHIIGMVPATPMQKPQGLEFLPLRAFPVKAFTNGDVYKRQVLP